MTASMTTHRRAEFLHTKEPSMRTLMGRRDLLKFGAVTTVGGSSRRGIRRLPRRPVRAPASPQTLTRPASTPTAPSKP
jgi:hypothetical protein